MVTQAEASERERLLEENADLFGVRAIDSRADVAWSLLAVASIVVFALELGAMSGPFWGAGIGAIAVFALGSMFKRFRFKAGAAAVQLRTACGLLVAGAVFAGLGPRAWISIGVFLAVGSAKTVRESIVFVRLRRRMIALGLKRRIRPANLVPGVFGAAIGVMMMGVAMQGGATGNAMGLAAWLVGYSVVGMAMEIWG